MNRSGCRSAITRVETVAKAPNNCLSRHYARRTLQVPHAASHEVGRDTEGVQVFSHEEQVEHAKVMDGIQRERRDCRLGSCKNSLKNQFKSSHDIGEKSIMNHHDERHRYDECRTTFRLYNAMKSVSTSNRHKTQHSSFEYQSNSLYTHML